MYIYSQKLFDHPKVTIMFLLFNKFFNIETEYSLVCKNLIFFVKF